VSEPFREARAGEPGTGTRAHLSAAALRHNLALATSAEPAAAPLAADGWGHGAPWVRDVLGADAERDDLDPRTLYGLPDGHPDARPVLTLTGRVLSTKLLRAGEGVSYGYAHRAPDDTVVALVTGGYAQGIVRMLGNRVSVLVGRRRLPLIGRIAMDVCVLDAGDEAPERGAVVTYFGDPREDAPSLAEWTHATGWTAGELVTATGLRARRETGA
jgi:alanine racemase